MGRGKSLSIEPRGEVVGMYSLGLSMNEIAKRMRIARGTVQSSMKKHRETGTVADRPRSGRPRKTTPQEDRLLRRDCLKNWMKTSPQLATSFRESTGKTLDPSTVRRRLLSVGLRGYVAAKKPLIRQPNKVARLKWAREHVKWTEDQWKKVLWSDGAPFQLFRTKGRVYVRRQAHEKYKDECLRKTVKHVGGTMMVYRYGLPPQAHHGRSLLPRDPGVCTHPPSGAHVSFFMMERSSSSRTTIPSILRSRPSSGLWSATSSRWRGPVSLRIWTPSNRSGTRWRWRSLPSGLPPWTNFGRPSRPWRDLDGVVARWLPPIDQHNEKKMPGRNQEERRSHKVVEISGLHFQALTKPAKSCFQLFRWLSNSLLYY